MTNNSVYKFHHGYFVDRLDHVREVFAAGDMDYVQKQLVSLHAWVSAVVEEANAVERLENK